MLQRLLKFSKKVNCSIWLSCQVYKETEKKRRWWESFVISDWKKEYPATGNGLEQRYCIYYICVIKEPHGVEGVWELGQVRGHLLLSIWEEWLHKWLYTIWMEIIEHWRNSDLNRHCAQNRNLRKDANIWLVLSLDCKSEMGSVIYCLSAAAVGPVCVLCVCVSVAEYN